MSLDEVHGMVYPQGARFCCLCEEAFYPKTYVHTCQSQFAERRDWVLCDKCENIVYLIDHKIYPSELRLPLSVCHCYDDQKDLHYKFGLT